MALVSKFVRCAVALGLFFTAGGPGFASQRKAELVIVKQDSDTEGVLKQFGLLMKGLGGVTGKTTFVFAANDIKQVNQAFAKHEVDIFIDSIYKLGVMDPTSQAAAELTFWRKGKEEYDGCIAVKKNSPLMKLSELRGKKIVFPEPISTSGFALPIITLLQDDPALVLKLIDIHDLVDAGKAPSPVKALRDAKAKEKELVYAFAFSDESAISWATTGAADAVGVECNALEGNADIKILARSHVVPRAIVAFHKKMDTKLKAQVIDYLIKLPESDPGLIATGKTKKVEFIKPEHKKSLEAMAPLFKIVRALKVPKKMN